MNLNFFFNDLKLNCNSSCGCEIVIGKQTMQYMNISNIPSANILPAQPTEKIELKNKSLKARLLMVII